MHMLPTGLDSVSSMRMDTLARISRVHLSEARMRLLLACGRLNKYTTHDCAHTQQVALEDAHRHAHAGGRVLNILEVHTPDALYPSILASLRGLWEEYHDIMASIAYMQTSSLFISQETSDTGTGQAGSQAHRQLLHVSELVGVFADLPPIERVFADMPCDNGMYD